MFDHTPELVASKLEIMEDRLLEYIDSDFPEIREMGRDILRTGGKKIRPALLLLCAKMSGYEGEEDITLAQVVELIHIATLVHDDIIDEAELRRGATSANSEWGNGIAVLLGDFLYTSSIRLALKVKNFNILRILSDVTSGMIQGELIQLYSKGALDMSEDQHIEILKRKTAYLFSACCRLGGILAGVDEKREKALSDFGLNLGIAFQLVDDLLDYSSDVETLGKPLLKDLREGKITLPLLYIHQKSEDGPVRRILANENYIDEHQDEIIELARKTGAIKRARERADRFLNDAAQCLNTFPESPERTALMDLSGFVVNRDK